MEAKGMDFKHRTVQVGSYCPAQKIVIHGQKCLFFTGDVAVFPFSITRNNNQINDLKLTCVGRRESIHTRKSTAMLRPIYHGN
jgi:hypothetical protein